MKKLFQLNKTYDLIRIGRDNDGGYLVERKSLTSAKFLVGMGLSDDWSFEKEFVKFNKVGVHVYDHTVNSLFWLMYYLNFNSPRYGFRIFKYFQYLYFFRNKKHLKESIGQETSLKKVISRIDSFPIFLKIDIEGFEYLILEELILHSDKICGVVIEFHNVPKFKGVVRKFISAFDLQLVHVHGNNYGGRSSQGYPLVMEMTFARRPVPISDNKPVLPHPLDMVNKIGVEELNLDF